MLTEGSYEARIAGVVRRHLEKRFGDWVSFEAIMVVLRTDQWGKDSVHVYVVYDGNGEPRQRRGCNVGYGGRSASMDLTCIGLLGAVP